jgi:4a-hydroxytetrahydrobiopterin dehydratase
MTSRDPLTGEALTRATADLAGWTVQDGKLHKEFTFPDFVQAFGFMASAALCAERRNHHPEWFNVYNRVRVDLSTHDADAITMFDVELAGDLDRIAGARG